MAPTTDHLVGLLLGAEEDWPTAFEALARRLGVLRAPDGGQHTVTTERLTIEPFNLRDKARHELVIDRLAHWYYHPREWLKKVALMDDVYLLNSPFTFQSMEKHSAYCALMRLGMNVPETVLVPYKHPVDNARWAYTSARYNRGFDLDQVAEPLGYPLYMKPFDGGGWRGVSQVRDRADLHRSYDDSGEMLMHLQASVPDYEHFARSLTIGPETMVMKFRPEEPMHERYAVAHGFLSEETGREAITISQTVNAFFRWEFNSCEMLVKDGVVYPIDYANACPDVAVTSLHYYFPWAMKALLRWTAYCVVTGRAPRTQVDTGPWFAVADDDVLDYQGKLAAYQALADDYFETERYRAFCESAAAARRRDGARVDRRPRLRERCCTRRSSRPTRRTSGSGSRRTSAACSGCGCPTSGACSEPTPRPDRHPCVRRDHQEDTWARPRRPAHCCAPSGRCRRPSSPGTSARSTGCSTTGWWRSGRTAPATPRAMTWPRTGRAPRSSPSWSRSRWRCSWPGPPVSRSSSGRSPARSTAGRCRPGCVTRAPGGTTSRRGGASWRRTSPSWTRNPDPGGGHGPARQPAGSASRPSAWCPASRPPGVTLDDRVERHAPRRPAG